MKRGKAGEVLFLLTLAILATSPFVFAGLGDWWNSMTGKATSDTTALQVTVGNTAPTVYQVNNSIGAVTLNEGTTTSLLIRFNASDTDGVANLNDASAAMSVSKGGTTRTNSSCAHISDFSSNNATYECLIRLNYYDYDGTWTINASIYDINGGYGANSTITFTVNLLHAWQLATGSTDTLNWSGSLSPTDTNVGSSNDPFTLNNTGNDANLTVNVTAYNLLGTTSPSYWINASDIRVSPTVGGCTGGNLSSNATEIVIDAAELDNANTVGTEDLYFCIISLPSSLTAQNYSSSAYGSWTVETQT